MVLHSFVMNMQKEAEAAGNPGFRDKNLDGIMMKIDTEIDQLVQRNKSIPRVKVTSGLRGTKYYIEFPFGGQNIDSFSILKSVEKLIEDNKKKYGTKVTNKDNYMSDGKVAYLVDY